MDIVDKVNPNEPPSMKLKASSSHKGPYEFDQLQHIQDLSGEHIGPIWCMKFSTCGRLLATAGQDRILRVWVIRSAYAYFQVVFLPGIILFRILEIFLSVFICSTFVCDETILSFHSCRKCEPSTMLKRCHQHHLKSH